MFRTAQESNRDLPDVSAFIEKLALSRDYFPAGSELFITRAPGRLDVMGGIGDYSGSLVLEMPTAEAALVALQKLDSRVLEIRSVGGEENGRTINFEMPMSDFERGGHPISYADAQIKFREDSANHWAAYIAGAFLVLMREKSIRFEHGSRLLIDSNVPEGKGVSSSAAVEVAAMSTITAAFEIDIDGVELARLCQKLENLIVGAPCGIMDQMSSTFGEAGQLLSMICQPAELQGIIQLPAELAVWGIDSGIRHSVGAGDYGSVRTGAFMGYRIIADVADLTVEQTEAEGVVRVDDDRWNGYLANVAPDEFEQRYSRYLPKEISGREFLERYGGITDAVTRVIPDNTYAVLNPTRHPIHENARVHQFVKLLAQPLSDVKANELGQLMYGSHASYSACGLGTDGTDLLVDLARRSDGLFGAKITGGGSGGTVAVLSRKNAGDAVREVVSKYASQTGYHPHIFSGSSMGAAAFEHLKIVL